MSHHHSFDALRWLAVLGVILALALLCGCTQTRTEKQADTEKRDTFTVEGDAAVPMPQGGTSLVPVRFTVERVGSERLVEHSESKTQIDGEAIARQISTVVSKSIDAALAKLTGFQPTPAQASFGITPTEGTLAGTLGGLALFAGREYMARRRLVRQRDELASQAVELAKQVPPPRGDA